MATEEAFTLDGQSLSDANPFRVISAQWTPAKKRGEFIDNPDSDGSIPVETEERYENSQLDLRIRITPQANADTAMAKVGQLQDKLQSAKPGSPVSGTWTPAGATTAHTFYVLRAEATFPMEMDGDDFGWAHKTPVAMVTLTCKPFLYGAETSAAAVTGTTPTIEVTVPDVAGDVPAEGRLVVTDGASQDRWHVEWGMQTGSAAEVAKDILLSQPDLTNTGFSGTSTTRSGSYSTNIYRGTLTSAAYITVCGTGAKTNIGTYRVRARVYASGTGSYSVRLAWRDGDGPLTRNAVNYALDDQWSDLDLGTITIQEAVSGSQSWEGRIEAKSTVVGDTLDVDIVYLIPAERYGLARRIIGILTHTSITARSAFTTESGAITGDSLSVGGTWGGAGDADDFTASGGAATRSALNDTSTNIASGRLVTASGTSAMTNTLASVEVKTSAFDEAKQGLLLRYVDATNFLTVNVDLPVSSPPFWRVQKVIAGTATTLASAYCVGVGNFVANTWYPITAAVDAGGHVLVWVGGVFQGSASDSTLLTGGTLDDGKVGIVDWQPAAAPASTRSYANFTVSPVEPDAVIFSGRAAEFRHNVAIRQNAAGTIYGNMPLYRGSRFYIPPEGDDSLQSRIVVKARRNDVEHAQDNNIADSTTARVYWTPRFLTPR